MLEWKYVLELSIPKIDFKIDRFLNFSIIKTPVDKLATIYNAFFEIENDEYIDLLTNITKYRKNNTNLPMYFTIYVKRTFYDCDLGNTVKNVVNSVLIKNKKLKLIDIRSIIPPDVNYSGRKKNLICNMTFVAEASDILANDYSCSDTYYNSSPEDVIINIKQTMKSHGFDVFYAINPNNHVYNMIHVDQDISLLSIMYFIQKYYKVSNNIPIFFCDTFSSNIIFSKLNTYKMYELDSFTMMKKYDISKARNIFPITYNEGSLSTTLLTKFLSNPSKIVYVHNDGDTEIETFSPEYYLQKADDKDGEYANTDIKSNIGTIYNLYSPDTPQLSKQRFLNTMNFISNVLKISRVEFKDVDFRLFDIGVLYKITSSGDYDSTFLNLSYLFSMDKQYDNVMRCDVIGDFMTYDV